MSSPVPEGVTRVDGCNCGGHEWHRTDCSLFHLSIEDQQRALDAARARLNAYTDWLNQTFGGQR